MVLILDGRGRMPENISKEHINFYDTMSNWIVKT